MKEQHKNWLSYRKKKNMAFNIFTVRFDFVGDFPQNRSASEEDESNKVVVNILISPSRQKYQDLLS